MILLKNQPGNRKCSLRTSKGGLWFLCSIYLILITMVVCNNISTQNSTANPPNVKMLEDYKRQTDRLTTSIAHLKEKIRLLTKYGDVDMFCSLRPKIGKRFSDGALEERRLTVLRECRLKIVPISVEELDQEILSTRLNIENIFDEMSQSQMSHDEYMKISNDSQKMEIRIASEVQKDHTRKVNHFVRKLNVGAKESEAAMKPEKKIKHIELKRQKNVEKNRVKNAKKREKKRDEVKAQIQTIKSSNLVHNFSSMEVPDSAYMFLALGSLFVPSNSGSKHDDIYDI